MVPLYHSRLGFKKLLRTEVSISHLIEMPLWNLLVFDYLEPLKSVFVSMV